MMNKDMRRLQECHDELDKAVTTVLKYKSKLTNDELNSLYFNLYVEMAEREQEDNRL